MVSEPLLHDLDDSLHAKQVVTAPVLGVHEAHLDVDAGLGRCPDPS